MDVDLPNFEGFLTPNPADMTYFKPDFARRPEEQTIFEDLDDREFIWDIALDPDFDVLEMEKRGNDHRMQIKTLYTGINPTKTETVIERTMPCYDKEDPMMVGLGLDHMWNEQEGKGRGWGNGVGARQAFQV